MKFIFLIIVMLTQFALQLGSVWSASPSYPIEETTARGRTEKEESKTPAGSSKTPRKQHEK